MPTCGHANKRHKAKGKCVNCYAEALRRKDGRRPAGPWKATCHPSARHKAIGLCVDCYPKSNRELLSKRMWIRKLRREFGISEEIYNEKYESQGGVCAICKQPENKRRLSVDHKHGTSQNRGLLCGNCNRALGLVQENVETLLAMVDYLHKWEL